MIRIGEISINNLEDYEQLYDIVKLTHIDEDVVSKLRQYVGLKCDTILVEYPYYDNDYLSNYYAHYSQKFKKYEKACYRLHYENGEDYLGYTVLRPTPENTKLGRTYLDPKVVRENDMYIMEAEFKAHVQGHEQKIICFPWKRQECDVSCCAHTAIWTILKYFGTKYSIYQDTTIGEIVEKVNDYQGRKTPTLGLTPTQVADVLKKYGFSPIIIKKDSDYSIIDEVLAYIESGLPVVGFFNILPENHAVSIIGHGKVDYSFDENKIDGKAKVILSTKLINSVYVMDDRYFPYMEVPKGLAKSKESTDFGLSQMDYAVIPLYHRMQLEYKEVYNRMVQWVNDDELNFGDNPVCRIYITSSNSLKKKALENDEMHTDLKDIITSFSFPKFVWCIDFAEMNDYMNRKTAARIIVDTTSATMESEPWILKHDSKTIIYKDDELTEKISRVDGLNILPYRMYENNLMEVRSEF